MGPAALLLWVAGLAGILTLDDPRLRFLPFSLLLTLSAAAWLLLLHLARAGRLRRGVLWAGLGLALAARAVLVGTPPAFSEDIFRYVYEGRAVWWTGPTFPFVHPPAAGPDLGLPAYLFDAAWLRINHAGIPTIYPPVAQLVFAVSGGLADRLGADPLPWLKAVLVAAELGAWGAVALTLRAIGRRVDEAVVLALCPILVLEVAREGHADSLALLGLALGVAGFATLRPRAGYAGWALAALAKLNGLVVLVAAARATRRGLVVSLAMVALLALPFALAGPPALRGLVEYGTRWRSGDGAFSLWLSISETLLGGDWRHLAGVTVTRHALARALTAITFVAAGALVLRRPYPTTAVPARAAVLLLLVLLLGPTLHPWYALWLLPFLPFARTGRKAMVALLALVWLNHHAAWVELVHGAWAEWIWARAAVHGPVWLLFVWDIVRPVHRADEHAGPVSAQTLTEPPLS